MSLTVELHAATADFPVKCVRCLSPEISWRAHHEAVGYWATLINHHSTRDITLQIPVCRRCAWAPKIWLAAAVVVTVSLLVLAVLFDAALAGRTWLFPTGMAICLALFVVAAVKRPLTIVKIDPRQGCIRIKFKNNAYAREFLEANKQRGRILRWWQMF